MRTDRHYRALRNEISGFLWTIDRRPVATQRGFPACEGSACDRGVALVVLGLSQLTLRHTPSVAGRNDLGRSSRRTRSVCTLRSPPKARFLAIAAFARTTSPRLVGSPLHHPAYTSTAFEVPLMVQ